MVSLEIENILKEIDSIDNNTSPEDMWIIISNVSKSYERSIEEHKRRSNGVYYTDLSFAKFMIDEMFDLCLLKDKVSIEEKKFLEPCVGTGNFVFAYLRKIYELGYSRESVLQIIRNMYVADVDDMALSIFKKLFSKFVYVYFGIQLEPTYFKERVAKGLLFDISAKGVNYVHIKEVFPEVYASGGFDIVVTNPPYKNLKTERNKYSDESVYNIDKYIYKEIADLAKAKFKYANVGVLNLYKLFTEEIITNYSSENAVIGLLIPSTILTDKSCTELRTLILENHGLKSVNILKENNIYLDAQQALCSLLIAKSEPTNLIRLNKDYTNNDNNQYTFIDYNNIKSLQYGNAIFTISNSEYQLLKKLRSYPVIRELPFIINMRGELDLTLNRKYITDKPTGYKLIRGRNIGYYHLNNTTITEYVNPEFVEKSSKSKFIRKPRIACQQVVNIHKERRITFSYIENNNVLANSCNYIFVEDNEYGIDLYALLGIMNSTIINWLFKLTSSNNHVNNYELDELPLPVGSELIPEISRLAKELLDTGDERLISEIDKLVYRAFNIHTFIPSDKVESVDNLVFKYFMDISNIINNSLFSVAHANSILNDNMNLESILTSLGIELNPFDYDAAVQLTEKYRKIKRHQVLNHITFKLSDLDLEMVRSVPQGGNWKNIPEHVVKKSKRLQKIAESGGRTTLYGRIAYNKPSYTITTYFNRPGNGTYIHPEHDRVISVREAARFQSFKDDYYFVGNKRDLLNQVGNAVPPLLAYQIAKKIRSQIDCQTSIDLFCGAGGMTAGFKEAGIKSIVGVDIDRNACITLKVNNPEINVICDDIRKAEVKDKIFSMINGINIDMVCGGPPCQGFSHAGKRSIDDPRNDLFRDFVDVISHIKPKVIVMENVEGMLTFLKGKIYNEIIQLFTSLDYKIEGRVLLASEYGVPQKRKRVIIICVRNDLNIEPKELFPEKITKEEKDYITAWEAINDLANIECNENAFYNNLSPFSLCNYAKLMRGFINYSSFVCSIASKSSTTKEPLKEPLFEQLSLFDDV